MNALEYMMCVMESRATLLGDETFHDDLVALFALIPLDAGDDEANSKSLLFKRLHKKFDPMMTGTAPWPQRQERDINLDNMSMEELGEFADVVSTLSQYAHMKRMAMRDRNDGRINDAIRAEAHLERLYQTLPDHWRW